MEDVLGGFAAVSGLISLAISIVMIIAQWKMFVKMGEPGWACLIPFYNTFVLAKHAFGNGWAMFVVLIPVVGMPWFFMKVFQGFGVETVPAILLSIFIAPIGMLIYGFNGAEWQGQ